jgi:hypothetical protein
LGGYQKGNRANWSSKEELFGVFCDVEGRKEEEAADK